MWTHASAFRATLGLHTSDTGLHGAAGTALAVPEFLREIKIEGIIEELLASLVLALLTVIFFRPAVALGKKALRRLGFAAGWREAAQSEEDYEELYLGWLRADLKARSRPLVPTPAHTKEPLDPLVKKAQRASLLRFDTDDYERDPDLKESDLPTRVEYGNGVPIKDLVKELKNFKKIVVLGDPGSGKSVCLRRLAYDLCEEGLARIERGARPRTLPIYVEMGAYDGWKDKAAGQPLPIIEFLKKWLHDHSSVSEAPGTHSLIHVSEKLERILRAGRATLIFDALDEMPPDSYQERYETLKGFVITHEAAESNRFVFSCRVLDYDSSFYVSEVIIDRFDLKRIRDFLWMNAPDIAEELYQEVLKDKDLEKLVSNPFFLQAWTYINLGSLRQRKPLLPPTPGELIKLFAETMLTDDVVVKQKKLLAPVEGGLDTLRRFLAELAFSLQQRREGRTSARPDTLRDVWEHYPQWKRLLLIARRARILGKLSESFDSLADADPPEEVEPPARIEFMHHRLQEYFAAEELGRRLSQGEPVEQYLEDIWWQETVVFAIGVVPDPGSIIERVIARQQDAGLWFDEVLKRAGDPFADDDDADDRDDTEHDKAEDDKGGGAENDEGGDGKGDV